MTTEQSSGVPGGSNVSMSGSPGDLRTGSTSPSIGAVANGNGSYGNNSESDLIDVRKKRRRESSTSDLETMPAKKSRKLKI